jgi:hypothetical protein
LTLGSFLIVPAQVFVEIGDWRPLFPTRVGEELGDIGAARFNIYNKELEIQLISATSEFYARESSQWIGTDSCPEYMKKVRKTEETALCAKRDSC